MTYTKAAYYSKLEQLSKALAAVARERFENPRGLAFRVPVTHAGRIRFMDARQIARLIVRTEELARKTKD